MGLFSQGHSTRPDASWLLEERSPYQSYPVLLLSSRGSPLDDPHRVLPLRTSPKLYPDHAAGGRPTCKQILTIDIPAKAPESVDIQAFRRKPYDPISAA